MEHMNIAIFTGGDSSEYVISMKSAEQIHKWLKAAGHTCYLVEVKGDAWTVHVGKERVLLDKNSFSFLNKGDKVTFDFAWNTIHGTPGEDGKLQGCFDIMGIPYSSSDHLSSALTFNKYTCKSFLKQHNVLTPEASLVSKEIETDLEAVAEIVGFPCFVKPNSGGSSFGIAKVVRFEELQPALEEAFREDHEAIVERYIKGTEVTCGLMKRRDCFTLFPITEIIPKNEFFDYEAKYTEGKAEEYTPARIDDDVTKKCQDMAMAIYNLTNCSGIIRVDFIIKGNQVYFLELNSIPGMSEESIIPKQVRSMGLTMETVLQQVIEEVLGH
ncbi:MAG: D-alanine--D-alanine ligase [Bacteroidales bacterium]|nr:D-alanine--D-alanine ligase [Bacteroidales bacterium]